MGDEAQPGFENQNRWESVRKTRIGGNQREKTELLKNGTRLTFVRTFLFAGPAPGEQASVECVAWGAGRLYSCGLHGQVVNFVHVHCSWVDRKAPRLWNMTCWASVRPRGTRSPLDLPGASLLIRRRPPWQLALRKGV